MVKRAKKDRKIIINTINSVLIETKPTPKSKQQIDKDYYQKNKERKKARRKELYAQKKEISKGKSWNTLTEEQQSKLIKYLGYEKARKKNNYLTMAEKLARQSQEYLKDIELAKFHEERGKIKCPCYQCQESKRIQGEIKKELLNNQEQCPECQKWVKKLDEGSEVCQSCQKKYE